MKLLGALLGFILASSLYRWAPDVLLAFANATSVFTGTTAIAAALTALWAIGFQRLTSFEKLDDLSADQKAIAVQTARRFRRAIIFSISVNALVLISAIALIMMSPMVKEYSPYLLGFWLLTCIGIWMGGFSQSIKCVDNIENSRLAIAATQEEAKRRAAYLKKMREDEAKTPVNREDPHLKSYTGSPAT